ncbi:MAG: 4Fe-4S binding protein [Treponema sp.]|nr:4Fe-4S binding protein [Treponema sp.]
MADLKTERKIAKYTRWIILGLILAGTMVLHYLHTHGTARYPSVHAICPLGGLENLWIWIGGKGYLMHLFSGTMVLFFFLIVFALFFGKAFCGNICPLGALQELIGKLSKRKIKVLGKADRILRLLKYLVLAVLTVMAWFTAALWISPCDPWAAFAMIWSGTAAVTDMPVGFVILAIVLIASVFIDRFFCKYLCPAGALYGLIAKIGIAKIKRSTCINCGLCSKNCPMDIDVAKTEAVKSAECIACGLCVIACPSKTGDVQMTIFGKPVKPLLFVILTVVIFFGGVFAFDRAGIFRITGGPGAGRGMSMEMPMREGGGGMMQSGLRGSMSIEAAAATLKITVPDFYKMAKIPETVPKETQLRNVPSLVPGWNLHEFMNRQQ